MAVLGGGRDHRDEIRAARDVALDLAIVVVASLEPVHVEPGGDAGRFQSRLDPLDGGQVVAGVADEHRAIGHLARRRHEALRGGHLARAGQLALARLPALVQFVDELLRAAVEARAHADLLQERHQPLVLAGMAVGKDLADIARVRQAPALGHAQEQPRQPVGEVAADEQQVVVFQFVEQFLRHQVVALQRADELQRVLVGNHVGRRGRQPTEQVVDHRPLQRFALTG